MLLASAAWPGMSHVTRLLQLIDGSSGPPDEHAVGQLYDEVRRLARSTMRGERADHTLVPTALANEAWVRLFGSAPAAFASSAEFFAAAATVLRRVLVEHGRRRSRLKRGGGQRRSDLEVHALPAPELDAGVLAVDAALTELAAFDLAKARLVELRFFGGLTVAEAANVLGLSERTAARQWRVAAAFLRARMQDEDGHGELDA